MEFVRVVFPDARGVEVDGALTAQTNRTFMLDTGTYRFSLAGPMNYLPPSIVTPIRGTSPLLPAVLTFTPVFADVAEAKKATKKRKPAKSSKKRSSKKRSSKKRRSAEAAAPSPAQRRRGGGSTAKAKKRSSSKKSSKKSSAKKRSRK